MLLFLLDEITINPKTIYAEKNDFLCIHMSLFITSLNSGSNGNCYYIGNSSDAILVDAGISCKETENRMALLGLSINNVKAIFISHEHTDHIKGLSVLAEKYNLPVYITKHTASNFNLNIRSQLLNEFAAHQPVNIGSLTITGFPKHHDAIDPHSFVINCNDTTIGVFTDIGAPCEHVIKYFRQCNAAFLEANYDEDLLENGNYPYFLKNRIRSGKGHLSNKQALEIFVTHRPTFMTHLLLAHLSKDNNCPVLVEKLFTSKANGIKITVASRYQQTDLYNILPDPKIKLTVKKHVVSNTQLSLF